MDYHAFNHLVEKASAGDAAAFEELYKSKLKSILFRISQKMGGVQDAEDIAQDVVLKMYQNIGTLREARYFNPWLQKIITNECNMALRKKINKNSQPLSIAAFEETLAEERVDFLPASFAEDEEKRQALMEHVKKLPEKQRTALTLFYYENMSYAEIAAATDSSVNAVAVNINKAKKNILQKMNARYGSSFAAVGQLASVPVLTTVFNQYANSLFPEATVTQTAQKCAAKLGGAKVAATAATAHGAAASSAIASFVAGFLVFGILVVSVFLSSSAANPVSEPSPSAEDPPVPQSGALALGEESETIYMQLSGHIQFVKADGETVENSGYSPGGIDVVLYNAAREEIARTTTDLSGNYTFGTLPLQSDTQYFIELDMPQGDARTFVASGLAAMGFLPGQLQNSENTNLYITVAKSPEGKLVAHSNYCPCGHINPHNISFVADETTIANAQWNITTTTGGEVLYSGDGATLSDILQTMLQNGQNGAYTLHMTVTDVFGNSSQVKYDFIIDASATPAQYS